MPDFRKLLRGMNIPLLGADALAALLAASPAEPPEAPKPGLPVAA